MGKRRGGSQTSVVGYRYRATMQLALCHGPVDAIRAIWFADKPAWQGELRRIGANSRLVAVHNPGLFGGEDSEGGVSGNVEVGFGSHDQNLLGVNDDGTSNAGEYATAYPNSPAPAWAPPLATHYRGLAILTFLRFYIGMNPYMKDVSVEAERYWRGWEPDYAQIGPDANPAHIIYECLVNDQWGLGYDASTINQDSFRAAAIRLYNEGLGLTLLWSEQQTIEDFIDDVKECIDATFYLNAQTGLWELRLVREGDPVVAQISNRNAKLIMFRRKSLGETVNQLNVKWVMPETEEFVSLTLHDHGNIEAQGQVVPGTREYQGVRNETLAAFLGQRDLRVAAATLAEIEVEADRSAWNLNPGDVAEFTWPDYGITTLKCRVKEIRHQENGQGGIFLDMVEDVFGQVDSVFSGGNDIGWEDGRTPATQFDDLVFWEVPYWFVNLFTNAASLDTTNTFGAIFAVTSNGGVRHASLYSTRVLPSEVIYEEQSRGPAVTRGQLVTALPLASLSTMSLEPNALTGNVDLGLDPFVVIGRGVNAEIARIKGRFSRSNPVHEIDRGVFDTHPRAWPTGTEVFVIGQDAYLADPVTRSLGEQVGYRVTMQTSSDATQPGDVTPLSATMGGRQGRPYPPQNIRIGGEYWPAEVEVVDGTIAVAWSTRNRRLQDSDIHVLWSAGNVVSEDGVTYRCRLLQGGSVLDVVTTSGSSASLTVGSGISGQVTVELSSEREGLTSYQTFSHTFTLDRSEPVFEPVVASNPGSWPIPQGGALTRLPLYTRTANPLGEMSSSGVFTPAASGNYRIEATVVPSAGGTMPYAVGSTFRLGFGAAGASSNPVTAVATASGFVLELDREQTLVTGTGYSLYISQDHTAGVRMDSAVLTITRLS